MNNQLKIKDLLSVYIFLGILIVIFIPNIYIKNNIYYISKDIGKLQSEYEILLEENKELTQRIEKLRFKY